MADIKQAAKWMQAGKTAKRHGEEWVMNLGEHEDIRKTKVILHLEDILAEDWEIAS